MRPHSLKTRSISLPVVGIGRNNNKVNIPPTICNADEEDTDKLQEFKQLVKCLNVPSSVDEYFYMKWLRARSYDLEKAKEMLSNHLQWRESCTYLDNIMNFIAPEDVLQECRWKKLGLDEHGRPIYCFLAGRVDVKGLLDRGQKDNVYRYIHKLLETLQTEMDTQRRLTGYGKAIALIDLTGFTFAKAMSLDLIQFCLYFCKVFEANYPEALYRAYVLNANWFFTSVFNAIKPCLSYETVTKIQIHGYDQAKYLKALLETVPIELIPEEFGGSGESIEYFEESP